MSTTIHTASDAGPDPHATLSADWSDGYRIGCEHGYRAGYADAETDMDARWHEIADPVAHPSPSRAVLELRRWGPGGREHFADPRAADYQGVSVARDSRGDAA